MRTLRLAVFVAAAGLAAAVGCNKLRQTALKQPTANDLQRLRDLYAAYYDARGHGPAAVEELESLARGDGEASAVLGAVRAGRYVLLWGVDFRAVAKTRPGMAFTVLGYERSVPESGGMVLMVDGGVQEMKPAKFAAAPKGNALKQDGPG